MRISSNFYYDGFNLYHGICKLGDKTLLWINVEKLSRLLIAQLGGSQLNKIHYFTSYPRNDPEKLRRHKVFIDSLETSNNLDLHFGKYKDRSIKCYQCGNNIQKWEEKYSDVAIGCQIIRDVLLDKCDSIHVVTGDSDILPALELVKKERPEVRICVHCPPHRGSRILLSCSDRYLKIDRNMLVRCKMPETIFIPRYDREITMPEEWK